MLANRKCRLIRGLLAAAPRDAAELIRLRVEGEVERRCVQP